VTGANRDAVAEPKGRTGAETVLEVVRSSRPGTLTLEWRPSRGGSRCRRAKGRYERPGPEREAASGVPEGIDPVDGETVRWGADGRSARRSQSRSSMPCMPVVSELEIGSAVIGD